MKLVIWTMILFIPFLTTAKAQNHADTLNFFPLQTGNYWEYWGTEYGNPVKRYSVIKGDTLMQNGKRYFICYENYQVGSGNVENFTYYRTEGDSVLFQYIPDKGCPEREVILFNFSAKDSSMWPVCGPMFGNHPPEIRYYLGVYDSFMDYYLGFVDPIQTKVFTSVVTTEKNGVEETLWNPERGLGIVAVARGVGIVYSFAELSPVWRLAGAIINGKTIGTVMGINDNYSVEGHQNQPVRTTKTCHLF